MSNREKAIAIIDSFTEAQLDGVVEILQFMKKSPKYLEELEDDVFCQKMLEEYENDPDPDKHEFVPIEDFAKELGITL